MSRNNNVRGPTSALTEFLKESGITPTTIARRAATRQAVAGPSNSEQNEAENNAGGNENENENDNENEPDVTNRGGSRRQGRRRRASGYASDELDEPEEETSPKKRKLSKAAQEKLKAKAKDKAEKKSKKDDNDEDEDEDAYTALSKSMWTNKGSSSSMPPVGSFDNCAKCEKQFTVTRYTMAANPPPGFLCHQCAKSSGADPFKKPTTPRKRKAPSDKRNVVHYERRCPTLVKLCIQIISRHIDDVEALGDIGSVNLQQISKAISRNRCLTLDNAHLFYDVQNATLTLYDVTKLSTPALCTLAYLNPNLTSLRLDFCGRMDDTVINTWCTALPSLKRIELLGPFLVRVSGWKAFFESHPKLEGFLITQSPRFDVDCVKSLVENCKDLKEVRLKEVGKIEDAFVDHLKRLQSGLQLLDLSDPTYSLTEEALIDLMSAVGSTLTHLDLSKHDLITDAFLEEGIKPHTRVLTSLSLSDIPELTDEGVAKFFSSWADAGDDGEKPNPQLSFLNLSRNSELSSDALSALLAHSGSCLQQLNINGWKTTSQDSLNEIGRRSKDLKSLDVGWCREFDDFVLKATLEGCERLNEIKCWGCNKITENSPRKRSVNIFGVESHTMM